MNDGLKINEEYKLCGDEYSWFNLQLGLIVDYHRLDIIKASADGALDSDIVMERMMRAQEYKIHLSDADVGCEKDNA